MNTITRRTALAVPVTLPLLPVSAFAGTADDPVLVAHAEWQQVFRTWCALLKTNDEECPMLIAADDAEIVAQRAVARAVATTPEGLAAQIRFAFYSFGDIRRGGDWDNPADYRVDSFGAIRLASAGTCSVPPITGSTWA